MLLHDIPALAARRAPDRPALVAPEGTTTFAELAERTARLADALRRGTAATTPGDRVAVVADNCRAWVECYYGVPRAGLVLTFLNQRLHPAEQASLLATSGATVLLGQRRYLEALDAPPTVRTVVAIDDEYEALVATGDPAAPAARATAEQDDLAWLLFTSGTTGRPKGAMLSHRSVVAATLTTALARPVQPDDAYLFPFPLCHVAGYNVALFHLHARPVVLLDRFDAAAFTDATNRHAVTATSLAPTMINGLLDDLDASATATAPAIPTLRSIGYGASPIPPALLERTLQRLPHVGLNQGYGMTELSGNAVLLGADDHRRGGHLLASAGTPSPLVALSIRDDHGAVVPPGATGEITVAGDQVLLGYWDDPAATADAFIVDHDAPGGRWFRTGDLGRVDDDGYLYVVDRKKDIIVTGGENVASREVEDVVQAHPAVREAAVVGVPDAHWGEAVCAIVVLRPGMHATADEIVGFVRTRLAGFKKPRQVVFVDALPRNAGGKVLKHQLRDEVAEAST